MVHYGILWCIIVYYGILWYIMVTSPSGIVLAKGGSRIWAARGIHRCLSLCVLVKGSVTLFKGAPDTPGKIRKFVFQGPSEALGNHRNLRVAKRVIMVASGGLPPCMQGTKV